MAQCLGGYLLHLSSLAHFLRVNWVLEDISFEADTSCRGGEVVRSLVVSSQVPLAAYAGNMALGLLGSR